MGNPINKFMLIFLGAQKTTIINKTELKVVLKLLIKYVENIILKTV